VHAVVLWGWHAPGPVQASLASPTVHVLQHLSLLGSAGLFWWALIQGRDRRIGDGVAVLYVFTTSVHASVLGALLSFAPSPWYTAYAESTGPWGLTPLEDQQLAGLIMWVPGGLVYLAAGLALFAAWLGRPEVRVAPHHGRALGRRWRADDVGKSALICGAAALLIGLAACDADWRRQAAELTGGDPDRGRTAIRQRGCPSCHTIPGIPGANGLVGPPLAGIASRVYIAGVLPNRPENMLRWLQNPPAVDEHTAMPNMGIGEAEARDIARPVYPALARPPPWGRQSLCHSPAAREGSIEPLWRSPSLSPFWCWMPSARCPTMSPYQTNCSAREDGDAAAITPYDAGDAVGPR
jgi:putative membrane protein